MKQYAFIHPADQIVEFMQRIYDCGMTTISGGNLSILDSDGDMWISPSGVDKGSLRRDDIMRVTPDGKIIGRHRPSVEYPFHRSVYQMRSDVGAVMHAHPPALVAFSVAARTPNPLVHPDVWKYCGQPGFAPYDVPGSDALGKKVGDTFRKGCSTSLLENHGTCVIGKSLMECFQRFETLDFAARITMNAMRLGTPHYLTEAQIKEALTDRNTEFKPFTPTVHTSEEQEMRQELAKLIRRAYRQQLFTSTSGSYAMKLSSGAMLVSPSGMDRANLQPEDLVLIDCFRYEAGKTPSRMTWFAKQLFEAQPEVKCLVFAVPPFLTAYGVANVEFDPRVIPESYIQLREVPTYEFGAQYLQTADLLKTLSPRYPVIRIKNDCVITTGTKPLECLDRLEVAEYSAKATIAAGVFGGMTPINAQQVADLVSAFKLLP